MNQPAPARRGPHPIARTGALVALLMAGLSMPGCGQKAGGPAGGFAVPVVVQTLHMAPVTLTRELPGRTSAFLVADVRPQVGGILKARLFTEGALVKAGQPLYQIDDALYRAQLETAQASLAKAEAAAHAATLAAERSSQLIKSQLVSRQDNDTTVANAAQAQAEVAAARAAVDTARLSVSYARVVAPISGRIGKSSVTPGALVTANQPTALATIQQLDPIYVDLSQPSADSLSLRRAMATGEVRGRAAGTPVQITFEDGSAYAHEGRLQFADVSVDPSTGNFLLRALVPNPEGLLMPGMFVRATISEGTQAKAVVAPQSAVQHDPKGNATALVVGADGKVEERQLRLARAVAGGWLVESGLAEGDRLVIEGTQKVQAGMPVQATEAGSASAAPPGPPAAPAAAARAR
jgi:membrane fusion protein (multidrug efflux system)